MMKKKLLCLILCFNLMLLLCSCGFFGERRYVCDTENIKSIQIVALSGFIQEEQEFEYTVVSEVSDYLAFAERLNGIKQRVAMGFGDPSVFNWDETVIKINYLNGDFDLIYFNVQVFKKNDVYQTGHFIFDDDQFNALLSEYIG